MVNLWPITFLFIFCGDSDSVGRIPTFVVSSLSHADISNSPSGGTRDWSSVELLRELKAEGKINLSFIPANSTVKTSGDAFLLRPTTFDLSNLRQLVAYSSEYGDIDDPLVIGMVSRNLPQLALDVAQDYSTKRTISVFNCHNKVSGNADSVSDLVVWYFIEMLRPLSIAANYIKEAASDYQRTKSHPPTQMSSLVYGRVLNMEQVPMPRDLTWKFLGAGQQVQRLLPRLAALGITRFLIWYYKFEDQKDRHKWARDRIIVPAFGKNTAIKAVKTRDIPAELVLEIQSENNKRIQLKFSGEKAFRQSDCDFISIHAAAEKGSPHVDSGFLETLREPEHPHGPTVLINVARENAWDEYDVKKCVEDGRCRVASDVHNRDFEVDRKFTGSDNCLACLPDHFFTPEKDYRLSHNGEDDWIPIRDVPFEEARAKVLLTPHVGSETSELQSMAAVTVGQMLYQLGIDLSSDQWKSLAKVVPEFRDVRPYKPRFKSHLGKTFKNGQLQ